MAALCLRALALACLLGFAVAPAEAGTTPGEIRFQVLREGQPFGVQTVSVRQDGATLTAQTGAELRFNLGPVTFFHYVQRCTENWRDGVLVALNCTTRENGKTRHVRGAQGDEGLGFSGSAGDLQMPLATLPTSWWTRPPLTTREMINTDTGGRLPVRVMLVGREMLTIGGRQIATEHIRVHGTLTVDLWYDEAGHWVNCAFTSQGQHMTYRLLTASSQAPS